MEIFGNPITGYTTEFYSILFEQMGERVKNIPTKELIRNNINCKGYNCHINGAVHYSGNRGSRNSSSQICQEGLEIRINNKKANEKKAKDNYRIRKILNPKWRYFNKEVFGEL
jgi:hypothetical protein